MARWTRVVAAFAAIDDGRLNAGTESVKGIPQTTPARWGNLRDRWATTYDASIIKNTRIR